MTSHAPMQTLAFDELAWRDAPMPDGSGVVRIAPLPALEDGAFRAFVRFPPGWERAAPGSYAVPEEIFVLEGSLTMNGVTWGAGGYVWVPAGAVRAQTRTLWGCLAFAWFGGTPQWQRAEVVPTSAPEWIGIDDWRAVPVDDQAGGSRRRFLRQASPHSTWISESPDALSVASSVVERLALESRAWSAARPGQRLEGSRPALWRSVATGPLRSASAPR